MSAKATQSRPPPANPVVVILLQLNSRLRRPSKAFQDESRNDGRGIAWHGREGDQLGGVLEIDYNDEGTTVAVTLPVIPNNRESTRSVTG